MSSRSAVPASLRLRGPRAGADHPGGKGTGPCAAAATLCGRPSVSERKAAGGTQAAAAARSFTEGTVE
jgi:hypothetical protein